MSMTHGERPKTLFDKDLEADLQDASFSEEYEFFRTYIETVDEIVRTLDATRSGLDLSKAELARRIGANPAAIRRLLSDQAKNPTLATVAKVAAALGLRLRLEEVPEDGAARQRSAVSA